MVTDVNWTYRSDRFAIYTNIKSLHCTPETNVLYLKTKKTVHFLFLKNEVVYKTDTTYF